MLSQVWKKSEILMKSHEIMKFNLAKKFYIFLINFNRAHGVGKKRRDADAFPFSHWMPELYFYYNKQNKREI